MLIQQQTGYTGYMETDSALIERITYTASLATTPEDIDSFLDSFREVTSRADPSRPLDTYERAKLLTVQQQLEEYLVTRERLRLFTQESLQLQIEQHIQGGTDKKSRIRLILVLAIAFGGAVTAASVLQLSNIEQRIQVGGATAFSLLTVGAGWLFLTALPAFKSELRKAFLVICTGVIVLGISLLEQPVMEVFGLRQYWLTSILYPLPILVAAALFHTGDAMYVRLIGIKNFWTTAWPVVIACALLSVITWFLPHPATSESELVHDIAAVTWACITVLPIASAIILPMAVRRLPELYKPSARFLFWSMFPVIAVCAYQYIVRIVAGPYMTGAVAYVLFSMVTIMGITLLSAGYTFNKVSRY